MTFSVPSFLAAAIKPSIPPMSAADCALPALVELVLAPPQAVNRVRAPARMPRWRRPPPPKKSRRRGQAYSMFPSLQVDLILAPFKSSLGPLVKERRIKGLLSGTNQRGERLADGSLPIHALRRDRQPDSMGRLRQREGHPGAAFTLQTDEFRERVGEAERWREPEAKAARDGCGPRDISSELAPGGLSVAIVGGSQAADEVVVGHGH